MAERTVCQFDTLTGEVMKGCLVYIPARPKLSGGWFMVFQEAFEALAKDPDLTGETWRILSYLFSKLDFENDIHLAQKDIAEALNMRKQNVSRAMKLLCDKQIVLKGPKVGRASTYHLNAYYGWKGKVKNLKEARKAQLKVIDGGKSPSPDSPPTET
jgi:hypothetical protein